MIQSIDKIRTRLTPAKQFASDALQRLLLPIGYQYRRRVMASFDSEVRALPFALQEKAPKRVTDRDLENITFTVALTCYYRSIIVPLVGARRFSRRLEKSHGIAGVQLGTLTLDKASRRVITEISNGFDAMVVRMGIPPFMLQTSTSRDLISSYFKSVVSEAGLGPGETQG